MKVLLSLILAISFSASSYALNHLPSPQQPSSAYFPNLSQGTREDPFYNPPTNYVITGNDRYSTTFTQSGAMDTVPYHDTGTDGSTSYKLQPDWKVPLSKNPAPNRVITYPPIRY